MSKKHKPHHREYVEKTYEEVFNCAKLAYIIANAEQVQLSPLKHLEEQSLVATVNALKDMMFNIMITPDDFPYGKLKVKYWRHKDVPIGRLYPNKLGYCNLSKILRHTLSDNLYFDLDIVNCHPTLYLYLADKYQIRSKYRLDMAYLEEYVNNRDNVLVEASQLNNCDVGVIKDWFLKVFCGADAPSLGLNMTSCMSEVYEHFSVYVALLYSVLKQDSKYNQLDKSLEVHSFVSLVVQDYENQIRDVLERWCGLNGWDWSVNCFDGGMILKRGINEEICIQELEAFVLSELQIPIKLALKPMDRLAIPIPSESLQLYTFDYVVALCGKNSSNYETRKAYFELSNFFCMATVKYCSEHPNTFYLYNKADFICKYEDILVTEMKKDVEVFVSFIKKWIVDENKRKYYTIGLYPPGCIMPKNPNDASDINYCYSLWKGWKVQHVPRLLESLDDKVTLLRSLTCFLWNNEPDYIRYIECYLKRILLRPGDKTGVCVALKAVLGGEGKNTWFEIQSRLFGVDLCTAIQNHERDWFGPFNEVILDKIFIHLEEMNKDLIRKYLKQFLSYITSPTILINLKGGAKRVYPSFANYFMTFNSAGVDSLPGIQRRLFIHEFQRVEEPRPASYYRSLYDLMEDAQVMRQYYDYIMSLDMTSFEITKFPVTPYMTKLFGNKEELAVQNLSRVESYLVEKITVLFNDAWDNEAKFKGSEWYEDMKTHCPSQYLPKAANFYREIIQVMGPAITKYMRQGCIWFKLNLDAAIKVFESKSWRQRSDFMNEEYVDGLTYSVVIPCWKQCEERRTRDSMTVKMMSAASAVQQWKRFIKTNPTLDTYEHTCNCGAVYRVSKE